MRKWGGLGNVKSIPYDDIDDIVTVILQSKYNTYNYTYIISKNKTLFSISEFYHKNYNEISTKLQSIKGVNHQESFRPLAYIKRMIF